MFNVSLSAASASHSAPAAYAATDWLLLVLEYLGIGASVRKMAKDLFVQNLAIWSLDTSDTLYMRMLKCTRKFRCIFVFPPTLYFFFLLIRSYSFFRTSISSRSLYVHILYIRIFASTILFSDDSLALFVCGYMYPLQRYIIYSFPHFSRDLRVLVLILTSLFPLPTITCVFCFAESERYFFLS